MKFVIFDIDGTLANTKTVDDHCFIKAFEESFHIDIRNEIWENLKNVTDWGITEEIIQRECKRYPTDEEYQLMISNLISNLKRERERDLSQFSEVSGARDFFYELKTMNGFETGIATGAWEKSAQVKLHSIGIELDGICFSNSDHHKSRESITLDVIDQLKAKTQRSPEQVIYFGDGEWDYRTCQNLGIDFIGIDIEDNGKLKKLGAHTIFQDYSEKGLIMKVLRK